MLELIEPRLPCVAAASAVRKSAEPTSEKLYKWVKIYDMRDEVNGIWSVPAPNPSTNSAAGPDLEIWGSKVVAKTEKRIDKVFTLTYAADVLQRNAK